MKISSQQTPDAADHVPREHKNESSKGGHRVVAPDHKHDQGVACRKTSKVITSAPTGNGTRLAAQYRNTGISATDSSNGDGFEENTGIGEDERMPKGLTEEPGGRAEEIKPKHESLSQGKTSETKDGTSADKFGLETPSKYATADNHTAASLGVGEDSIAIGPLREASKIKRVEAAADGSSASHGVQTWEMVFLYEIEAMDLPDTTSVLLGGTLVFLRCVLSGMGCGNADLCLKNAYSAFCACIHLRPLGASARFSRH